MAQLAGVYGLSDDIASDDGWEEVKDKIKSLKSLENPDRDNPFVVNEVSTSEDLLVHLKATNCKRWA